MTDFLLKPGAMIDVDARPHIDNPSITAIVTKTTTLNHLDAIRVRYQCHNDTNNNDKQSIASYSLLDLFWCEACSSVLPRDARHTVTEIDSFYCPHTLENVPSSEAMSLYNRSARAFVCPCCSNVLSAMASTVKTLQPFLNSMTDVAQPEQDGSDGDGNDDDSDGNAPRYYLACGYCRWDSLGLAMVANTPEELTTLAVEAEQSQPCTQAIKEIVSRVDASIEAEDGRGPVSGSSSMGRSRASASVTSHRNVRGRPEDDDTQTEHLRRFPWNWTHIDAIVDKKAKALTIPNLLNTESELVLEVTDNSGAPTSNLMSSAEGDNDRQKQCKLNSQAQAILESLEDVDSDNGAGNILGMVRTLEQYEMDPMAHGQYFTRYAKPSRLPLRTKQAIRCRQCFANGKPNILVKPQINPLKGDSSLRTNVGAWFKKCSHAYDTLIRFVARDVRVSNTPDPILSAEDDEENETQHEEQQREQVGEFEELEIELVATNPLDVAVKLSFDVVSDDEHGDVEIPERLDSRNAVMDACVPTGVVLVGAYDELEMLDLQLSALSSEQPHSTNNDSSATLAENNLVVDSAHNRMVFLCKMRLDKAKLTRTGVAQVQLVVTMRLQEEDSLNDDADEVAVGDVDNDVDESRVITFGIVVDVSQLATLL